MPSADGAPGRAHKTHRTHKTLLSCGDTARSFVRPVPQNPQNLSVPSGRSPLSADIPPAAWYAGSPHDVFDERHDTVLWDLALTQAGLDVLDAAEALDEHGDPEVLVLPCTHPPERRAVLDDLPAGDPDRVEVCGVCSAEHADGRWSA